MMEDEGLANVRMIDAFQTWYDPGTEQTMMGAFTEGYKSNLHAINEIEKIRDALNNELTSFNAYGGPRLTGEHECVIRLDMIKTILAALRGDPVVHPHNARWGWPGDGRPDDAVEAYRLREAASPAEKERVARIVEDRRGDLNYYAHRKGGEALTLLMVEARASILKWELTRSQRLEPR